ncbi:MAG: hypothetical protein WA110_08655, partial [Anaerolineaceae bacterium]
VRDREVGGPNPPAPTIFSFQRGDLGKKQPTSSGFVKPKTQKNTRNKENLVFFLRGGRND